MIWSIIQVAGQGVILSLTFAILALLLNPSDFGILGMAVTWIAFIQTFSELGFGAALIQRQNVGSRHFSTIFFINLAIGILLTLIGILISWPCSLFFKTPSVQPVMAILSFGFVVNSLSLTQSTIAQKELMFRKLAIRDISAAIVGGILGITLAYFKFGVWSLVAQSLTTYLIAAALIWNMSAWKPKLKEFSFQCVKELWSYSSKIYYFQIFKYFAQNIDKMIIGYLLGAVSLGLYTFAYKIVVYPIQMFVGAVGNYLFSQYSRIQDDLGAIKKSCSYILKLLNILVIPLMVIVVFLSPILIPSVFGQKWILAVPVIQILAVAGILIPLISLVGALMKALDRPGWLLNWSMFVTAIISIFIYLGVLDKGVIGAAFGFFFAYLICLPILFFILYKLVGINLGDIMRLFATPAISGLFMGVLLYLMLDRNIVMNSIPAIFPSALFSVSLYFISMLFIDRMFVFSIFKRLAKYI